MAPFAVAASRLDLICGLVPTACAVGYVLSPLRGWKSLFCGLTPVPARRDCRRFATREHATEPGHDVSQSTAPACRVGSGTADPCSPAEPSSGQAYSLGGDAVFEPKRPSSIATVAPARLASPLLALPGPPPSRTCPRPTGGAGRDGQLDPRRTSSRRRHRA